ncbi:hypothetical protein Athai_47420 [Actinocatenispora thailandica]|uniref:SWIM-type domain-containing protein n=1 Tax=Actinocatenispora thailandica TaxID=227318 RepID=A0A7R7DSY4_9ACTN|nr:SWIM zinc finger family protein [Actinocatenispora thailandica]BCJ37239.1 hypothetical protein Athai_47420 [Actinocatenispora thailandica]
MSSGNGGAGHWSGRFLDRAGLAGPPDGPDRVAALHLTAGSVAAEVHGSHPRPYQVLVEIPVFTPVQWKRVERALAADATAGPQLLAGSVPHHVESIVDAVGLALLPERPELELECSCPQWSVPCRHLIAVLHEVARSFDDDPLLMLLWRGRRYERLRRRLQALTADQPAAGAAPAEREPTRTPVPLTRSPRTYWLGEHPEQLAWPEDHPPQDPDPAPRHLDTPDIVIGRRNLTELLQPLYDTLTSW